jgi:integrase
MAVHMMPDDAKRLIQILAARSDLLPFELLLRSGCRTHELRSLAFTSSGVHVRAAKGSMDHVVPLPEAFLARLAMHWPQHLVDTANISHEAYKRKLRHLWSLLRKEHPFLAPYSLHSLRSGFAIAQLGGGIDMMTVKYLLGHRSLSSTAYYVATAAIETKRGQIIGALE